MNVVRGGLLEINDVRGTSLEKNVVRGGLLEINDFFLSWHAAKSFIKYLTMESFIPTSMLRINNMDYVARRNI